MIIGFCFFNKEYEKNNYIIIEKLYIRYVLKEILFFCMIYLNKFIVNLWLLWIFDLLIKLIVNFVVNFWIINEILLIKKYNNRNNVFIILL